MIQLYFLSVLCNGLSGYILFSGSEDESIDKTGGFLSSPTSHLVLGILSVVTGILKILSPISSANGKAVFLFGDLLPATAGIVAGLLLIFGIYRQGTSMSEPTGAIDRLAITLLQFRKIVGIAVISVAALHFIFAELPLL